jgi:hypothetical protein
MRATISILFFLATSTTASAVELPVANLSPVVLSESQSSILFIPPAMKADCSVEGRVTVRIVRKPKNGTIELTGRMGHTNFVKDNQRYKCNEQLTAGTWLDYVSNVGFKGKDEVEVEAFWDGGVARKYRLKISVR